MSRRRGSTSSRAQPLRHSTLNAWLAVDEGRRAENYFAGKHTSSFDKDGDCPPPGAAGGPLEYAAFYGFDPRDNLDSHYAAAKQRARPVVSPRASRYCPQEQLQRQQPRSQQHQQQQHAETGERPNPLLYSQLCPRPQKPQSARIHKPSTPMATGWAPPKVRVQSVDPNHAMPWPLQEQTSWMPPPALVQAGAKPNRKGSVTIQAPARSPTPGHQIRPPTPAAVATPRALRSARGPELPMTATSGLIAPTPSPTHRDFATIADQECEGINQPSVPRIPPHSQQQPQDAIETGSNFEKPMSEFKCSFGVPQDSKENATLVLTARDIRKMAKEHLKSDKVSNLLNRPQQNAKRQEDFVDLAQQEDKRQTAQSSHRAQFSKESLIGSDAKDLRFLRKRDRLTEFVELFMTQTHILRK